MSGCIFTTKTCIDNQKKLVIQQCLHLSSQYGEVMAEIGLPVWGIPANFNGFRVLASLLQRRRSSEANQTLHNVWPSPEQVHYTYTFGESWTLTELCQVQNSLCVQVLRFPILAALMHDTHSSNRRQPNFATWYICKEWNYGTFASGNFQQRTPPIFRGRQSVGHRPTF